MKTKTKPTKNLPAKKADNRSISSAVIVADLKKKAQPTINKLQKMEKIRSHEDYELAGNQMKVVKEYGKLAENKKAEMLSGLKSTIKLINEHFKPFEDLVWETEQDIKAKMLAWVDSLDEKKKKLDENFEGGKIVSISKYAEKSAEFSVSVGGAAKAKKITQLEIEDLNKIPREYLIPDESKIKQALKDGKKVPGCKLVKVNSIAI